MIFLRFPDESAFLAAAAPYTDDEGGISIPNLDIIGVIYTPGEYDEEGEIITPPEPTPGYHVNLLNDVPPEFWEYMIEPPATPYRVFAVADPAVVPIKYPRLTPLQLLDLFTESEQLSIVTATMTVPAVKLWYDRLIAATFVTYEDPRTEGGLQALVDAELITPQRKEDIVEAMQP